MRTSIATVCLSGSLEDKMAAAAEAGFDGIEVFEPDLVASDLSPEEVRARADRLGLSLDLYQPLRDVEGVEEDVLVDNLRRARARFEVAHRLGIDTVLVCSNVGTATIDSDDVSAEQLGRLGDLAASYGLRVAYEALAWGRYVADYRRAARIVELADHPAVGTCLDSFHILSRGHDPAGIEQIPGERIFFVQLADAPLLSLDVLSWSRHHRLFPGEGDFDLAGFVAHTLRAGYVGPLSLEVFNDTFRQTDTGRTAAHALRSLVALQDRAARLLDVGHDLRLLPDVDEPVDVDFVEVKAEDTGEVETALDQLGLTFRGQHRTKPVRLWSAGRARIVLNEQHARDQRPHVAAIGFQVAQPLEVEARARALAVTAVSRRAQADEQRLAAFAAPSGVEVFLAEDSDGADPAWVSEFQHGHTAAGPGASSGPVLDGVDHVNLVHTWEEQDEAVLFYTSVLGLEAPPATQVASPRGLVRSRVMRSADGRVRLPLNVAPTSSTAYPEHVALSCHDIVAVAAGARARGMTLLPVPDNYYDDLVARFALGPAEVARLREHRLLYDRDATGAFLHFYTRRIGRMFFEVVQRLDGYDGYGADNAHVRLAAQARLERPASR